MHIYKSVRTRMDRLKENKKMQKRMQYGHVCARVCVCNSLLNVCMYIKSIIRTMTTMMKIKSHHSSHEMAKAY